MQDQSSSGEWKLKTTHERNDEKKRNETRDIATETFRAEGISRKGELNTLFLLKLATATRVGGGGGGREKAFCREKD